MQRLGECSSDAFTAGFFDESNSPTWRATKSIPSANGTDALGIYSTSSLPFFPLSATQGSGEMLHTFGVGRKSSMLEALRSSNAIASKTWSIWQEWAGAQIQTLMNGGLVFGGFDAAKITGNNITLPFATDSNDLRHCPSGHVVTVMKNGSSPSVLGPSAGATLGACILPNHDYISFNVDHWSTFLDISGSVETGRSASPLSW